MSKAVVSVSTLLNLVSRSNVCKCEQNSNRAFCWIIARDGERVRQPDRTDVDSWRRTGPIDLPETPRREFREGGRGGFGGRGGRGDSSWGHSDRDSFGSRGKFLTFKW